MLCCQFHIALTVVAGACLLLSGIWWSGLKLRRTAQLAPTNSPVKGRAKDDLTLYGRSAFNESQA